MDTVPREPEPLLERRYISFLVRLLAGSDGALVSGEVWQVPSRRGRGFRRWEDLIGEMRASLERSVGEAVDGVVAASSGEGEGPADG
jgi:hypothetical protein